MFSVGLDLCFLYVVDWGCVVVVVVVVWVGICWLVCWFGVGVVGGVVMLGG